jgi:hypothetical protein
MKIEFEKVVKKVEFGNKVVEVGEEWGDGVVVEIVVDGDIVEIRLRDGEEGWSEFYDGNGFVYEGV